MKRRGKHLVVERSKEADGIFSDDFTPLVNLDRQQIHTINGHKIESTTSEEL